MTSLTYIRTAVPWVDADCKLVIDEKADVMHIAVPRRVGATTQSIMAFWVPVGRDPDLLDPSEEGPQASGPQ